MLIAELKHLTETVESELNRPILLGQGMSLVVPITR